MSATLDHAPTPRGGPEPVRSGARTRTQARRVDRHADPTCARHGEIHVSARVTWVVEERARATHVRRPGPERLPRRLGSADETVVA